MFLVFGGVTIGRFFECIYMQVYIEMIPLPKNSHQHDHEYVGIGRIVLVGDPFLTLLPPVAGRVRVSIPRYTFTALNREQLRISLHHMVHMSRANQMNIYVYIIQPLKSCGFLTKSCVSPNPQTWISFTLRFWRFWGLPIAFPFSSVNS